MNILELNTNEVSRVSGGFVSAFLVVGVLEVIHYGARRFGINPTRRLGVEIAAVFAIQTMTSLIGWTLFVPALAVPVVGLIGAGYAVHKYNQVMNRKKTV